MSRAIDRLPTPTQIRKKEIIVIARSRTGTLSVWQALNILGYRTYHGAEVIANGSSHIDVFEEALNAKYYGIGKPYGKAEFEKWFANYDALVEIPAVFLEEIVACYPDAKFIHIERDVDGWYKSVMNTLAESFKAVDRWPLRQLRLVDSFVDKFCKFHLLVYRLWWHGRELEDGEEVLKKDYNELNRAVKEILPKEKLNSFRLEDGFGWEQLCSVLEKPVPAVPYPRANTPERFDKMQAGFVQKAMRKAVGLAVTTVFVPTAAVAGWYYLRHVRS